MSSRIQGQPAIVLTLPLLLLMTVIFMVVCPSSSGVRSVGKGLFLGRRRRDVVEEPGAARHRLDRAVVLVDDRAFHGFVSVFRSYGLQNEGAYFLGDVEMSSRIQGQPAIVLTLPLLLLMTVIFMMGCSS